MNNLSIDIQNVSFSYPNSTPILSDISLKIKNGESVAIIGANGAGKSTLLYLLAGLLTANSGVIYINGRELTEDSIIDIRSELGLVFQYSDNQLFLPTVREDVSFGPLNQGLSPHMVRERICNALKSVRAIHLIDKMTHELSGGEKRSVAIAGVLAMAPNILLLDEPSSDLDPSARRSLITILAHSPHTKIITTHDLDLAMELCPRIIVLHEGKILADGSIEEIFNNTPLLSKARLEQPLSFLLKQMQKKFN